MNETDDLSVRLRRLAEVSRKLAYAISLEEVSRITVESARELLGASRAVLMLLNEDDLLSVRASSGIDPATIHQFCSPLDDTFATRLEELFGKDLRVVAVPFVIAGRVTGVLAAEDPRQIDQEWLLFELADRAGIALEKRALELKAAEGEHRRS